MKNGKILTTASVLLLGLFFFALEARAQTVTCYTSIDYYDAVNVVDAYSETDEDYDVDSLYGAFVKLSVVDQNWNQIALQSASDDGTYGFAAVEIQFYGSPDTTYTAIGLHKAYANQWDYNYENWPLVSIDYYDYYNFSFFENQNIFEPWSFSFLGPGSIVTRPTQPILLGATVDEAEVATSGDDVQFVNVAVDDGTPVNFESGSSALLENAQYKATVNAPCGGERFKVVVKFNLPQYSASCCGGLNSRISVSSASKFQLTEHPVYGYLYRFFPDTSPPAAPETNPPLAVAFVRRRADGGGSSNTLRVVVGGSYQSHDSYSTPANVHLNCN